jgi:LmbE family N-acetylglucosaminyl deacetylase
MLSNPPTKISFYIVAHADDWQLFMQPNAHHDLVADASKVVFIVTTAGDAGAEKGYWQAREEGMKSSIRFCLAPFGDLTELNDTRNFNARTINCCSINNTISYFLRLPDGGLNGDGFAAQEYESLRKLKSGDIISINAVDNSATYNWQDLCATIQSIILTESNTIPDVSINYQNPDTNANPNDHPDHIATGQAIHSISIVSRLHQRLFVGYSSGNSQEKLDETDLFWKIGMFATYEKAVVDHSDYSTLKEGVDIYTRWCLSSARFIAVNSSSADSI